MFEHFSQDKRAEFIKPKSNQEVLTHSSDLQILVNSGRLSALFNLSLCPRAAGADHQAPLAAFPPVLTFRTASPRRPPPQRVPPSCCGSSGPRSPSSFSSCSSSAWPAWFPWRRRTTAATTPTTLPAPSTQCCATPTDLRPYENRLNISLTALPRTPRVTPVNVSSSPRALKKQTLPHVKWLGGDMKNFLTNIAHPPQPFKLQIKWTFPWRPPPTSPNPKIFHVVLT